MDRHVHIHTYVCLATGTTTSRRDTFVSALLAMSSQPGKEGERAIVGEQGVTYGLQIRAQPEKQRVAPRSNAGVFGDDSSDSEDGADGAPLAKGGGRGSAANLVVGKMLARQMAAIDRDEKVKKSHEGALREDGSVFDYDAHVDAIQEARRRKVEARQQEKVERKSRYIAGLLETAEHRKREQEVLFEKRLEKEREAEEAVYGTTEKFVTGAYRRKLEEEEKWKLEQEKKREEDEANAVEKRGSMAGFYANYLDAVSGKAEAVVSGRAEAVVSGKAEAVVTEVTKGRGSKGLERAGPVVGGKALGEVDAGARQASPPRVDGAGVGTALSEHAEEDPMARSARLKREREEKIAEAKQRYLERKARS